MGIDQFLQGSILCCFLINWLSMLGSQIPGGIIGNSFFQAFYYYKFLSFIKKYLELILIVQIC